MCVRLTFFTVADLRTGRGCERVLLSLLKYRPDHIKVKIVQTDLLDYERMSKTVIDEIVSGCDIITIRSDVNKYKRILGRFSYMLSRLMSREIALAKRDGLYEKIRETDAVYLFGNSYSRFFSGMKIPIIGSNHMFDPTFYLKRGRFHFAKKVYFRLVISNLFYKYVNGFHFFPHFKKFLPQMKTKYNFTLPNGVDTNAFYPLRARNDGRFKFLFVAALTAQKGLDILIPLIKKSQNHKAEFHIAGTGPLMKELENLKNVVFHGVLDDSQLAELYRGCDVFIYPSHNDIYPTVVLQALSSGLYVLLGDFLKGSFDDFERLGFLEYVPMSIEAFQDKIEDLISGHLIEGMNRGQLHDYVQQNYDWSIISREFYSILLDFIPKTTNSNG